MINWITKEQLSINHILVSAMMYTHIDRGEYIATFIVFLMGVAYCALMEKLNNKSKHCQQ